MTRTCLCGKALHGDECGFHNHKYENILLLVCPYCKRSTFLEIPGMRAITFLKTMAKANDEAIEAITRFRDLFDFKFDSNDDTSKD